MLPLLCFLLSARADEPTTESVPPQYSLNEVELDLSRSIRWHRASKVSVVLIPVGAVATIIGVFDSINLDPLVTIGGTTIYTDEVWFTVGFTALVGGTLGLPITTAVTAHKLGEPAIYSYISGGSLFLMVPTMGLGLVGSWGFGVAQLRRNDHSIQTLERRTSPQLPLELRVMPTPQGVLLTGRF